MLFHSKQPQDFMVEVIGHISCLICFFYTALQSVQLTLLSVLLSKVTNLSLSCSNSTPWCR